MLFVGAGASKAFGIGDLADLTREINAKLEAKGFGQLLTNVNNALKESKIYSEDEIDIEISFTVLNSLSRPREAVRDLGPFAAYLMGMRKQHVPDFSNLPHLADDEVARIRAIAQDTIVGLCNKLDREKAKKAYDELFKLSVARLTDGRSTGVFDSVVTTNFDLGIEMYDSQKAEERGFGDERGEYGKKVLSLQGLRSENTGIGFLKLHGSIDWVEREDGKIFWREGLESLYGEHFRGRLMIYPIYEKYVSAEPYYSLFTRFQILLRRSLVYLVIGYSFRDPTINNAFADALRTGQGSRMIVVNRDAREIEKIRGRMEALKVPASRISYLPESFGEQHAIEEISKAFNDSTYLAG